MTARAVVAAAVAALAVAGAPALAAAQSDRYRKPPVDAEAEAEAHSTFWEEVVRPGATRYHTLVVAATDILRMLRSGDPTRARDFLREAVVLRADRADGWGYLGVAAERMRDYPACADAYGRAHAIDPTWLPTQLAAPSDTSPIARQVAARPLTLAWAVCLARSGELVRASRELEALVARGARGAELFLNLGQVHMAAGRINDAIAAFDRAVDEQRSGDPVARWLLAAAYDRARRTGDAALAAEAATESDPGAARAASSPVPLVAPGDGFYLLALGARTRLDQPRPEVAVVYLRKYLAAVPEAAPWRARAQEHLAAIGTVDLAARAALEGAGDAEAIQSAVRPAIAGMRTCMTELPTALVELRITQVGPPGRPAPPAPPPRRAPPPPPITRRPPAVVRLGIGRRPPEAQSPGIHAHVVIAPHLATRAGLLDQAVDCVEKAGQIIVLPRPPAETYSTVRVPVIADRDR